MHYNQLITRKNKKKLARIFYGLFAFNRYKGEKNIRIRIRIDIRISFPHFIKI
jgi:hypothetical protein